MRKLIDLLADAEVSEQAGVLMGALALPEVVAIDTKKAEAGFTDLTSHIYFVTPQDGNKRLAFREELTHPNEYLTAESEVHLDPEDYKHYALVLWAVTLVNRFARAAGLRINYSKVQRKSVSNAVEVALEYENDLLAALGWWASGERRKIVSEALHAAKARAESVKYKMGGNRALAPYIDWESAARGITGLRGTLVSSESYGSAGRMAYGYDPRPDEKAQFIRDYIRAEGSMSETVNSESAREMADICDRVEMFMRLYPLFDAEKTADIINTLRRSDCTRVSERQSEYLRRVLADAEDFHAIQTSGRIGGDLLEIDAFFGF
ncbi:hypothetical protein FACS1894208_00140 [Clostridia bacterium]|nr:hypothetical protein FACS1894208_00140 [Clostridia bacterium]